MYDPLELTQKTEQLVLQDEKKKYYRFRPTGFYGGIATADTVGCNLRCKFCWSGQSVWNAQQTGIFYSPDEVAQNLTDIVTAKRYAQVRISGGEPTIGRQHLLNVLKCIPSNLVFILETNGILLGSDKTYIEALSTFSNLHIRVCLKGGSREEFSWLTGAKPEGFTLQLKALEYLRDSKIPFTIALVLIRGGKKHVCEHLNAMGLGHVMLEEEEITLYPLVRKRLQQEGMLSYFS